ncbi:MAG: hypothetical protein KDM63_02535, partial [Verrucomicrobiae bacterium]|nr:hypothetical protein [Verrucomicrobiae bacterium]
MKSPVLPLSLLFLTIASAVAQDAAPTPFWIWSSEKPADKEEIYLRKPLTVPADLKRAVLIASADNTAQVMINGDKRGFACENWEKPIIEDITDRLVPGSDNVIAAKVSNTGSAAGFLALITFENN